MRRAIVLFTLLLFGTASTGLVAGGPGRPAEAAAAANQRPAVVTGDATGVGQTTATLVGTVDPNGQPTTYSFDYGVNKSFGSSTPTADAPAGVNTHAVATAVADLLPDTRYYFRVVATNATGTNRGNPHSFVTSKAPGGLSIAAAPTPVVFGSTTTITGQVSGSVVMADRAVTLESNPYPYSAGFKPFGSPAKTDAAGTVRFSVVPLRSTQFRLRSATLLSAVTTVEVRPRISTTMVRIRGGRVRITGSLRPGDVGGLISIQRKTSTGKFTLIKRIALTPGDPAATFQTNTRYRKGRVIRAIYRSAGGGPVLSADGREKHMF